MSNDKSKPDSVYDEGFPEEMRQDHVLQNGAPGLVGEEGGGRRLYGFENNYGASIVQVPGMVNQNGRYEVLIVVVDQWGRTIPASQTGLSANAIVPFLNVQQVNDLLARIERLAPVRFEEIAFEELAVQPTDPIQPLVQSGPIQRNEPDGGDGNDENPFG